MSTRSLFRRLKTLAAGLLALIVLHQTLARLLSKTLRRRMQVPAPAPLGRLLDSAFRRRLQPEEDMVRRCGIKKGMRVLDLGCGSGAFTLAMAKQVGEKGEVVALDLQPKMLKSLQRKLQQPQNHRWQKIIHTSVGAAQALPLPSESVNACCLISVLQEVPRREQALSEVYRVLKQGGVLAVSEFVIDPDYALPHTTMRLGEQAGFIVEAVEGKPWNYTVRFRKPQNIEGG